MPSREPRVQDSAIDGQEMPRIFTPILPLPSGRCDSHPDLGSSRVGSGAAGRWPLPMSDAACLFAIPIKLTIRLFSINLSCRQIGLRGGRHPRTLVVMNSENLRP